jgi:hypothetical protein
VSLRIHLYFLRFMYSLSNSVTEIFYNIACERISIQYLYLKYNIVKVAERPAGARLLEKKGIVQGIRTLSPVTRKVSRDRSLHEILYQEARKKFLSH